MRVRSSSGAPFRVRVLVRSHELGVVAEERDCLVVEEEVQVLRDMVVKAGAMHAFFAVQRGESTYQREAARVPLLSGAAAWLMDRRA